MQAKKMKHRGERRFWVALDGRYRSYVWPQTIAARCPNCSARMPFSPTRLHCWGEVGPSGRIPLLDLPVGGKKDGTGTCTACGKSFSAIHWPDDACFKAALPGGEYWAWNEDYLRVLRARVAGDRVLERQLCMSHVGMHYFLTRLPKRVVIRRNRDSILRQIDRWLGEGNRARPVRAT